MSIMIYHCKWEGYLQPVRILCEVTRTLAVEVAPLRSTVLALRRHHRGPILRASSSCSPADRALLASRSHATRS